jgi:hypothetical protein
MEPRRVTSRRLCPASPKEVTGSRYGWQTQRAMKLETQRGSVIEKRSRMVQRFKSQRLRRWGPARWNRLGHVLQTSRRDGRFQCDLRRFSIQASSVALQSGSISRNSTPIPTLGINTRTTASIFTFWFSCWSVPRTRGMDLECAPRTHEVAGAMSSNHSGCGGFERYATKACPICSIRVRKPAFGAPVGDSPRDGPLSQLVLVLRGPF